MFNTHQRIIADYARRGPDEFADVLTFVYLTVQQQLHLVPNALKDVKREGEDSRFLWGWKRDAYTYMYTNRATLYTHMYTLYDSSADPAVQERELLAYCAELPGLGLVKAGFVLQLVFGIGGCIDGHNVFRFQLAEGRKTLPQYLRACAYKRAKPATKARYIQEYQQMLSNAGGTEGLWDDWCIYVHSRNRGTYSSAYEVSAMHCAALGIN